MKLYNLEYRHHNDEWIYLEAHANQDVYKPAADTQYWYRSMTEEEFDKLNRNNRFYGNTYGGIAPYRKYVRDYFTNNSDGCYIVEFKTPSAGFLYQEFVKRKAEWGDVKAEGGGTYGLGPTGHGAGSAGAEFNRLLALRTITWEVVDLRISNKLA